MEAKDVTVLPSALDEVIKSAKKEMLRNVLGALKEIQGKYDPDYDDIAEIIELRFRDYV
jgi:hypothetical protein